MTTAVQNAGGGPGGSSSLADVIDTILDKGLVVDAQVNVSLVGIQLLSIDARVVVASVDTYLRFAEAVNRLDLTETQGAGLPQVVEGAGKKNAISKVGEILGEVTATADDSREKRR
jgi:gas vesicle structural protein